MSFKVCKFGGTSMADGKIIKSVKNIIQSDAERRYVVVSAPGKRYFSDKKVTDLLFACHNSLLSEGTCKNGFAPVCARFTSIVKELNINFDIISILDQTERRIDEERSRDFTASRGEYLCARILAEVLGAKFVDAETAIFFNQNGAVDEVKSYEAIKSACADGQLTVFPGFYGMGADGKIKTFSRGGSDVTGAIVARALHASLYENWTDVSGFFACDPQIVDNPKIIKQLSYKDLRELSSMGAGVVHGDSILYVLQVNIPIQIKNTFCPRDEGTLVLPSVNYAPENTPVLAIAGKRSFTIPYSVKTPPNIAFVSVVILDNNPSVGICSRVFAALDAANISAKTIIQCRQTSLTIGVKDSDYERCVKAIYGEFFGN